MDELTTDAFQPVQSPIRVPESVAVKGGASETIPPPQEGLPEDSEEPDEPTVLEEPVVFQPAERSDYLGMENYTPEVAAWILEQQQKEQELKTQNQSITIPDPERYALSGFSVLEEPKLRDDVPDWIKRVVSVLWKLEYGYVLTFLPTLRQEVVAVLEELLKLYQSPAQ